MVALKGLFTPLQKEGRVTFKALDGEKVVGFATWNLPKPKVEEPITQSEDKGRGEKEGEKGAGLPQIPGVNTELWGEKVEGPKTFYYRDVEPSKDTCIPSVSMPFPSLFMESRMTIDKSQCSRSSSCIQNINVKGSVLCSYSGVWEPR